MKLGWTPTEYLGGERGARVSNRDRALFRAVDLIDKTICSCGHSLLETTSLSDMGNFKVDYQYCEACRVKELDDEFRNNANASKGQKKYVIDLRDTE